MSDYDDAIRFQLKELHNSGIRYGKTLAEALQIVLKVMRGGYTEKRPLKVRIVVRNESCRKDGEYLISRYKKLIKEVLPGTADYTLDRVKFEVWTFPKQKPMEMFVIEDYVDFFKESEEE